MVLFSCYQENEKEKTKIRRYFEILGDIGRNFVNFEIDLCYHRAFLFRQLMWHTSFSSC